MNTPSYGNPGYGGNFGRPGFFGNGLGRLAARWPAVLRSVRHDVWWRLRRVRRGLQPADQLVVIGFVLRWVFRRFGGGRPAGAGYGGNGYGGNSYNYAPPRQDWRPSGTSYGSGPGNSTARGGDELGIGNADLNTFETTAEPAAGRLFPRGL